VPVRATVSGELVAVLVTVAVPVRVVAEVGAKTTLKEVDCPAARVRGRDRLAGVNPVPDTAMLETVMLELPEFVRVTDFVEVVPVVKLPKLRLLGEAESCSTEATLEPETGTTSGEVGELFTRERFA
jgi:hypothetical protein